MIRRLAFIAVCWSLAWCGVAPAQGAEPAAGFTPLFNGKSLDGWEQHGGKARYSIEGDEIVGTSVPGEPNSFLCTTKPYGDFILELDLLANPLLNSGVQIRSVVHAADVTYDFPTPEGKPKAIPVRAGVVHGYQVEIDSSERAWSGGIYDEARRGWLFPLKDDSLAAVRKAFRPGEWNHYRIEAIGDRLRTWVNGVPAADLEDSATPAGFIALQVHGIGNDAAKAGKTIRWKNLQLKEIRPASAAEHVLTYPGGDGPGAGKRVVLISGDEEYRSEEMLPQLASILSRRHGFECRVLFAIDPESGAINPDVTTNIPGLEALDRADLMVIFTRYRNLPDDQMRPIDAYLRAGKPVLGVRTATHALKPTADAWARYAATYTGPEAEWQQGFGRVVLGESWHTHHGKHKGQSTRGLVAPDAANHPMLRGIHDGDIWGPTDVYGVRLPLPGDATPLLLGQVVNPAGPLDPNDLLFGMRPSDAQADETGKNSPMMPIVWTKSYQIPGGANGRAVASTIGASTDFLSEGVRRVLVQSVFSLTGLEDNIPADGANVDLVGGYQPTRYEFRPIEYWRERGLKVSDLR